jgi:SAM-dependent methyltransferase
VKRETGHEVSGALKRQVVLHYEQQLRRYGATARGMDWKDEASQKLRFSVLCDVAPLDGLTVHEIACGAGHLADYLEERGVRAHYSGSDLSAEMIRAANERHPELEFRQRDILEADPYEPFECYDVVLCSGLFHVRLDRGDAEWWAFVQQIVHRMFSMCRKAIAFNLMTDQVDYRSPELFYADPAEVLDFCRRELSRAVTIRHDYPLYEFTTHVYRLPD